MTAKYKPSNSFDDCTIHCRTCNSPFQITTYRVDTLPHKQERKRASAVKGVRHHCSASHKLIVFLSLNQHRYKWPHYSYTTHPGFRFSRIVRGVWPHFRPMPRIPASAFAAFYVAHSLDSASRHAFLPHRTQRDRHTGTNISQAKLTHLFPSRKCDRGPSPVTRPLSHGLVGAATAARLKSSQCVCHDSFLLYFLSVQY